MAYLDVHFWGETLGRECSMIVVLPDRKHPPRRNLPVLYQLHGLTDDESAWMRATAIERHIRELPLVLVLPDGGRGFYTDSPNGDAWETHFVKDVVGFVERFFPVRRERGGRAIGGASMGGYGAMKIALRRPGMFASVAAFAGAYEFGHTLRHDTPEFRRILGDRMAGGPDDLFSVADRCPPRKAPAILMNCGVDDNLLDSSRMLHRHLRKRGIRHAYREGPGEHHSATWDRLLPAAVAFHWKHLRHP